MKQTLTRSKQCAKCPWRVLTDPKTIPNGYCRKKHKALSSTIAKDLSLGAELHAMACHEGESEFCVGWLWNQLGPGNNIPLRLAMRRYNLSAVEVFGEQHERFEETLK